MGGGWVPNTLPEYLGAASVLLANLSELSDEVPKLTTDIFGGFLITKRMLDLFRRPGDPPDYAWLYGIPAALFAAGLLWAWQSGQDGLVQAGYTAATFLCIGALTGLSSQVRLATPA